MRRPYILKFHRTSQLAMLTVSFFVLASPLAWPDLNPAAGQTADPPAALTAPDAAALKPGAQPPVPAGDMSGLSRALQEEAQFGLLSRSSTRFSGHDAAPDPDSKADEPLVPQLSNETAKPAAETAAMAEAAEEKQQEQEPLEQVIYVAANRLNLRQGPSTDSEIIVQLKFGDPVICQAELDGWVQVLHDGQSGYLSAEHISWTMVFRAVRETVYVSARRLNLRSGPSTEDGILLTLRGGEKLIRTGVGTGWSKVQTTSGKNGYVATQYITENPPVAERAVAQHQSSGQKEIDLFIRIVALESHTRHGYEGYLAVASVIMNRVASSRYPGTITRVVSQPGQFSVYTSTRTPHITDDVRRAVKDALAGKRNLPGYVLFFATPDAYRRNVARKGIFSKLEVHTTAYGHVWCYYAADR